MRLEFGALAAMACGVPAISAQTAVGDINARPVILTFSYTGELVQKDDCAYGVGRNDAA